MITGAQRQHQTNPRHVQGSKPAKSRYPSGPAAETGHGAEKLFLAAVSEAAEARSQQRQ